MDTQWTKTSLPCDCGGLERAAESPDLPVQFDERMGEFSFVYVNSQGAPSRLLIRHCFFCGGKAPASKRAAFFETISAAERERLWTLTRPLKTLADVLGAWGEPDREYAGGIESEMPEKDGQAGSVQRAAIGYAGVCPPFGYRDGSGGGLSGSPSGLCPAWEVS